MERVVAIESVKNGVVRYYGEGELIGQKVPDTPPFNELKMENPCIKLDNGKMIWGFQCWWGNMEKAKLAYPEKKYDWVIVELEEEYRVGIYQE